jgi:hypothetical protein
MIDNDMPYSNRIIGRETNPLWTSSDYVRQNGKFANELRTVELIKTLPESFVDQKARKSFIEFEDEKIVEKVGYNAIEMRAHGCGISALHTVLSTLDPEKYRSQIKSVGELAIYSLSLHTNDYRQNGNTINRGNPVFNLRAGWYHDALLYIASQLISCDVSRYENIYGWQQLAQVLDVNKKDYEATLAIASVSNKSWRTKEEPSSISTHLVVLNGCEVTAGIVSGVSVTDSFVWNNEPHINQLIPIDDRNNDAFTGRVMVFNKDKR